MGDSIKALIKILLVLATLVIVAAGIYAGYQYAFPPATKTASVDLPNLDMGMCASTGSGIDPTNYIYALQLQQNADALARPAGTDSREATFTVESGELPTDIAVRLERDGFVSDSDLFLTLLKCRHASETIQAGDHVIRKNMTMDEIVTALQRGTQRGITVTIRPGWRAEQIAEYLAGLNLPQFDKDEFTRLVQNGNFDYDFISDRPKDAPSSVEGFLFPETYNVLQAITAEQLINRFLSEYAKRITPEMRARAAADKLTLFEVMTLASIVEREAVKPEEAPVIAGVYMNRVDKGMLLNADPTVQYAVGFTKETKQWWPLLPLASYAKINSPYNTYIYTGLPPAPICEPGLSAIQAALEPAKTDYFYFLAKGDGTHVFAKTLEEQNANMAKYGYGPAPVKP